MINPQWLEVPMSRTNFHGPKDVRAIEVQLYYNHEKIFIENLFPLQKGGKTILILASLKSVSAVANYSY